MHAPSQLLIILTTICLCALAAHRLKVAGPIMFLLGGALLALVPGMGHVTIDPEYMLVIFLPPILMEAAFFTSIRDFRQVIRPILRLAVGLVVLTAVATAFTLEALLPGATLALGFVLGAIISPPDAAAATSALKHVRLPQRTMTVLEGESLVNDATGIVLFEFALAAVMHGQFSLVDAGLDFVWKAAGGVAVGLAVAWIFTKLYPLFKEPSIEIIGSFVPPYAAYVLAEHAHSSGVLAVVAAGLYTGWHAPRLFNAQARMPMQTIWKMTTYFLGALAFLLIGLQLPGILAALKQYDRDVVIATTGGVCAAVIIIRLVYAYVASYSAIGLRRWLLRDQVEWPSWQNTFLLGWTGMRGVVTLALALALPFTLPNGEAFPYRDLLIFISVAVILMTLVLQGLSLPLLVRKMKLRFQFNRLQEEWLARTESTRRALAILQEITECEAIYRPALERIRQHYEERLASLGDGPNTPLDPRQQQSLMHHPLIMAENRIWQETLRTERETVVDMRMAFQIGDDVMHEIIAELDLLTTRFQYVSDDEKPSDTAVKTRRRWAFLQRREAIA